MKYKYTRVFGFGVFLILMALGCDSITGADEERVTATIHDDMFLEIPNTVRSGEAVHVRFLTGLFAECSRVGETELEQSGLVVTVRPYNYRFDRPRGQLCVPPSLVHEFTVQFLDPGTALIRVFGLDLEGEETVVEREIVVEE